VENFLRVAFWIIYAAYLLSQVFIAFRYLGTGNKLYLKSLLVSNILFALYVAADEIFGIGVPYPLRMLVVASLFVHIFFGYFKDRYTRSKVFDRYLHAGGTLVYALFLYALLSRLMSASVVPKLFAAVLVAFTGIAAGAIFELVEFVIDLRMPVKTQRDLKDTDVDLLCNAIGAVLAGVAAYFFML
jgi:uncharacterized membrane protein YjdF